MSETKNNLTLIRPQRNTFDLGLSEIWKFRELLYVLAWRDISVRYKQTILGVLWAIIVPFATMVVFSIFLGNFGGFAEKTDIPYPVFNFAAMVPWTYFSQALVFSSNSLVDHRGIINKVYFPRIILPLAPLLSNMVDFFIAMIVLFGMMAYYGLALTPSIFLLPVYTFFIMLTVLSCSLWVSSLNAKYRDFRYAIPFLIRIWIFVSPVAYPSSIVDEHWRMLYGLNPMAGALDGFRWALTGKGDPFTPMMGVSLIMVFLLLAGGLLFFRRTESDIVDVI